METVGELLDDMDRARGVEPQKGPAPADPFIPATLEGVPPLPAPGIYFGMPFEEYRNLPALGSHGVGDILASPMIFWAKHAWLSETARKQAERPVSASTAMTRLLGEAYHARLLEGPNAYAARYAVDLSEDACKGALESTDQIKAAIKAKGEKPVTKVADFLPATDGKENLEPVAYERAAVKDDWVRQLLAIDPDACILSELRRQHGLANAGKQFLPFDAHEQIEIAAKMVEADEQVRHAFSGGYPEVTLIWHCAETGVPMKARVDYLKLRAAVDLKSYANEHRSPEEAIRRAITSYRYTMQPSVYWEGIAAVKALVRENWVEHTHSARSADADDRTFLDVPAWVQKWASSEAEPDWFWVFQAKGFAPVSRLVRYDGGLSTRIATDELVRQAKRRFRDFSERYGCEPWVDSAPAYDITDDDMPDWVVRI
jgi:hypothetical protein